MQLHLSTWQEVETYLSRSTGIVLPIGSTEQHGPNGLIGTDAICPEVVAKGVGEAALVPTAAAVAGALYAFDGIRRRSLPMRDSAAARFAAPRLTHERRLPVEAAK